MIHSWSPEELPTWSHFAALSDLEKSRLGPQSPWLGYGKIRTFSLEENGALVARLSAFVNPRLQDQAEPTGLVGFASFRDDAFARPDLGELAKAACAWLREQGMRRVRGPLNFCTWYTYRVETWSDGYPKFPGEDMLDARYAPFFESFMQPVGSYASQLIDDPEKAHAVAKSLGVDRAGGVAGISIRELARDEALTQMRALYDLASAIFPQDWSFGPIGYEEFLQLYTPLIQRAPEFHCVIAEDRNQRPVGLAFGYLHPFAPVKTGILKTIGVLPEYRRGLSRGVSWYVVYRYHMSLRERGYEHFVHATMKEDNTSRAMSSRFARKIRGYSLYEASL